MWHAQKKRDSVRKPEGKKHFEDLVADGRIILN
jgi:hypothetical protein